MSSNSRNTVSQLSGSSSVPSSGAHSGNKSGGVGSTNTIAKEGWGSRKEFQDSYLLGMDPEGIEEGNRILEGYQELDRQDAEARKVGNSRS